MMDEIIAQMEKNGCVLLMMGHVMCFGVVLSAGTDECLILTLVSVLMTQSLKIEFGKLYLYVYASDVQIRELGA